MKAIVSSAVLIAALSVLSGCSNDPTSEDFKEFAERYAKQVAGDIPFEGGVTGKVTCKIVEHNLRKTDSLTMPYEGTAKFDIDIANLFIYAAYFPGGKTDAIYRNRLELTFAWNGEKWTDRGGTSAITEVALPSIAASDREKYDSYHNSKPRQVTPEDSYHLEVYTTNGHIRKK